MKTKQPRLEVVRHEKDIELQNVRVSVPFAEHY